MPDSPFEVHDPEILAQAQAVLDCLDIRLVSLLLVCQS